MIGVVRTQKTSQVTQLTLISIATSIIDFYSAEMKTTIVEVPEGHVTTKSAILAWKPIPTVASYTVRPFGPVLAATNGLQLVVVVYQTSCLWIQRSS